MKRGQLYWANFKPRSHSEQQGRRPAILLSHDLFNQTPNWNSLIVVPVSTSKRQFRRGTTVVLLPKSVTGLAQDSYALCHQVTVLDRSKLEALIGTLTPELLKEVEEALLFALGMDA